MLLAREVCLHAFQKQLKLVPKAFISASYRAWHVPPLLKQPNIQSQTKFMLFAAVKAQERLWKGSWAIKAQERLEKRQLQNYSILEFQVQIKKGERRCRNELPF